jgi:hypothetical protein
VKIDGRCHCGQIEFETEAGPAALRICHCMDCQTLSGAAFRANVSVSTEHFKLLAGTPKRTCVLRKLRHADLHICSGSSSELLSSNRNYLAARSLPLRPGWTHWHPVPAEEKE